jgi:hypothetical protein
MLTEQRCAHHNNIGIRFADVLVAQTPLAHDARTVAVDDNVGAIAQTFSHAHAGGKPHIDGDAVEPVVTVNVDLLSAKLKVISGI